jgi:hypothetical protein
MAPGTPAKLKPSTLSAASVPSRRRNGMTLPSSVGWFRFESRMTKVRENGSIQRDVPVQPVCP